MMQAAPTAGDPASLKADCAACAGLCCVSPGFDAGDDFAFDKRALAPCRHLGTDNLCRIHETLTDQGFPGCAKFDCKGAGQYVTQQIFPRKRWRKDRETLEAVSEAYRRMRAICDMAELLHLAARLPLSASQEAARQAMLNRLLPKVAWTENTLTDAEEAGILSDARTVLTSFRDAATRR
ncbi:hypothetical protein SAMN04488030_0799 [Aliiroseovarius halocynthiae]|uniref:Uncharacterized protein n=1 Tax=Aliiroseovarius halocynthiae TaxID=985055 RepID=A0A545SUV8_9RHOB|nr:hypothetical protein [Aliiroseovarius halocynthiae]TQV68749.1 hypothetical protein FIL88_03985 [Aliiroseovarius halocynthiae]SMR71172.1 hypothetical protein SAMN04488030_0799 [Aliiroseovarius halocynthiae]